MHKPSVYRFEMQLHGEMPSAHTDALFNYLKKIVDMFFLACLTCQKKP